MTSDRSPLKHKPLRTPGQSLDEEIARLTGDKFDLYASIAAAMVAFAIYEWIRFLAKLPPQPWLVAITAVAIVALCAIRMARIRREIRNLRLGRDGERIVAEALDELRAIDAVVFHDVVAQGFNVDHVILSRHGVFVVETKTRSKRSDAKVFYDGKRLLVDGMEPERNPATQVTAIADWLMETLRESTGKLFSVRPVVVFPGWFVELTEEAKRGRVWVLNPKMLPPFVQNEPVRLSEDDVRLASYHLSRYIRTTP